ncbi:MAG: hypothetical protein RSD01_00980 [Ruthenibacterium sp.]
MGLLLQAKLVKDAIRFAPAALAMGKAVHTEKEMKKRINAALHPQTRKDTITMKKSTFAAVIVFLSAIAGALGAVYLYLRRREAELDEYEQLLFSEDFSHEDAEAEAKAAADAEVYGDDTATDDI